MEAPKKQQIVQNHILGLIRSGMRQGDLLPSIPELEKKLNLNKMTIGKAYAALESMDVLYKVPGKGTFVGIRAKAYKKAIPYFHRRSHEVRNHPRVERQSRRRNHRAQKDQRGKKMTAAAETSGV